jgi:hypothetical protein
MENMLVIVPTRGRPDNVRRLLDAFEETGVTCAKLLFCVDNDDPALEEYQTIDADILIGPRIRIGPTLNHAAKTFGTTYPVLGFMGDDHVPRTHGWDVTVMNALTELGTGIVYGNDLLQREALPTAVFITSNIVRELGYFCPPELLHMYLDNSWLEWGNRAECIKYLGDVIIEHMHPALGKAEQDASYTESGALTSGDHILYNKYVSEQLPDDVLKIKKLRGTA